MSAYEFLKEVTHPNVVHLLGVCTKEMPFFIIMEYMQKGNLRDFLQRLPGKVKLHVVTMIYMLQQVASAMAYLESLDVIHR